MSTKAEFRDYVVEQLGVCGVIRCRPMMGEYLLYCNEVLFGGFYDNRLLIKRTENNKKFNLKEAIPYPSAKPMYLIEDAEDTDSLKEIIQTTCEELRTKKK